MPKPFLLTLVFVLSASWAQETDIAFLDGNLPWRATDTISKVILELNGFEFLGENPAEDYRFRGQVFGQGATVVTNFNERRQLVRVVVNFNRFDTVDDKLATLTEIQEHFSNAFTLTTEAEDQLGWSQTQDTDRQTSIVLHLRPDDDPSPEGPERQLQMIYASWAWPAEQQRRREAAD